MIYNFLFEHANFYFPCTYLQLIKWKTDTEKHICSPSPLDVVQRTDTNLMCVHLIQSYSQDVVHLAYLSIRKSSLPASVQQKQYLSDWQQHTRAATSGNSTLNFEFCYKY